MKERRAGSEDGATHVDGGPRRPFAISLVCLVALFVLFYEAPANAQQGDCCQVHAGGDCDIPNAQCGNCVCSTLPQCCTGSWTQECVDRAASGVCIECGSCLPPPTPSPTPLPNGGPCCQTHAGTDCDVPNAQCGNCVCASLPQCCTGPWTQECVDRAASGVCIECGTCPATPTPVPTPVPGLVNGQPCSTDTECSSGACADGVCCNARCTEPLAVCNAPASEGVCVGQSSVPSLGRNSLIGIFLAIAALAIVLLRPLRRGVE